MDNTLMIGLSRQVTLRRGVDVIANNVANMSTHGFRAERPLYTPETERPAHHQQGPRPIQFVADWSVLRDFSPGPIEQTGRPFDAALDGQGFFVVQGAEEPLYTRNGRFSLDEEGRLVTSTGRPVLAQGGGEIRLDPEGPEPVITPQGVILAGEAEVARLDVVHFDDLSALSKTGEGEFRTDADPVPADAVRVRQGFVEGSNVNAILEITRLIEMQRSYEGVTRMVKSAEDLRKSTIEKLGRQS